MSITTASIFISNYLGLPIDIANCIARYVGTEKWIPQYDTKNNLDRKVNPAYFDELTNICDNHPAMASGRTTHAIVFNHSLRYDTANTVVQRRCVCYNGDIKITIYTSIEIARNVFDYLSITYVVSAYSTPVRQFLQGTLHCPSELLSWSQQQQVTSFYMENDVMFVNYRDLHVQFVWNNELNIGEYIVDVIEEDDDDYNLTL